MRWHASSLTSIVAALAFGACGDGALTADPQLFLASGDYTAFGAFGSLAFTTVGAGSGGETIDWLARGASVSLSLRQDGTTAGRLFVPGEGEDGSDFDADLAGTWSISGNVVRFAHMADTFVRDTDFLFESGTLTGMRTSGDVTVRLVLIRL